MKRTSFIISLFISAIISASSGGGSGSASASGSRPIDKLRSPVKVNELQRLSGYYNPHTHEWVEVPLPETPERFAAEMSRLAKSRLRHARTQLQAAGPISALTSVLAAMPAIPGGSPARRGAFKKQIDDVTLDGLNAAAAAAQTVENYQLKPRRRATVSSAAALSDLLSKEVDEDEPHQNSAAVDTLVRQARAKISDDPENFFQSPKNSLAQAFAKTPPPFRLASPAIARAAQMKADADDAIPARAALAPLRLNLDNIPAVVAAAVAAPPAPENQPANAPVEAPAPFWGLQQAESGKVRKERKKRRIVPISEKSIQEARQRTRKKLEKAAQGTAKIKIK